MILYTYRADFVLALDPVTATIRTYNGPVLAIEPNSMSKS